MSAAASNTNTQQQQSPHWWQDTKTAAVNIAAAYYQHALTRPTTLTDWYDENATLQHYNVSDNQRYNGRKDITTWYLAQINIPSKVRAVAQGIELIKPAAPPTPSKKKKGAAKEDDLITFELYCYTVSANEIGRHAKPIDHYVHSLSVRKFPNATKGATVPAWRIVSDIKTKVAGPHANVPVEEEDEEMGVAAAVKPPPPVPKKGGSWFDMSNMQDEDEEEEEDAAPAPAPAAAAAAAAAEQSEPVKPPLPAAEPAQQEDEPAAAVNAQQKTHVPPVNIGNASNDKGESPALTPKQDQQRPRGGSTSSSAAGKQPSESDSSKPGTAAGGAGGGAVPLSYAAAIKRDFVAAPMPQPKPASETTPAAEESKPQRSPGRPPVSPGRTSGPAAAASTAAGGKKPPAPAAPSGKKSGGNTPASSVTPRAVSETGSAAATAPALPAAPKVPAWGKGPSAAELLRSGGGPAVIAGPATVVAATTKKPAGAGGAAAGAGGAGAKDGSAAAAAAKAAADLDLAGAVDHFDLYVSNLAEGTTEMEVYTALKPFGIERRPLKLEQRPSNRDKSIRTFAFCCFPQSISNTEVVGRVTQIQEAKLKIKGQSISCERARDKAIFSK